MIVPLDELPGQREADAVQLIDAVGQGASRVVPYQLSRAGRRLGTLARKFQRNQRVGLKICILNKKRSARHASLATSCTSNGCFCAFCKIDDIAILYVFEPSKAQIVQEIQGHEEQARKDLS